MIRPEHLGLLDRESGVLEDGGIVMDEHEGAKGYRLLEVDVKYEGRQGLSRQSELLKSHDVAEAGPEHSFV